MIFYIRKKFVPEKGQKETVSSLFELISFGMKIAQQFLRDSEHLRYI
jgi:hypothetical protein